MATLAFSLLNAAPTIITGITSLVHAVTVEPAFDALVDAVVAFYNATGIFVHTGN